LALPWSSAYAHPDTTPVTTVSTDPLDHLDDVGGSLDIHATAEAPSADPTLSIKDLQSTPDRLVLESGSPLAKKFVHTPYEKAVVIVEGAEFAPETTLSNQTPAVTFDQLDPKPTSSDDTPSLNDLKGHEGAMWVESNATPSANATSIAQLQGDEQDAKTLDELQEKGIPAIDSSLATPEILVQNGQIRTLTFELTNVGKDAKDIEIEGVFSSKVAGSSTVIWSLQCSVKGGATCPERTDGYAESVTLTQDKPEFSPFHSVINMPKGSTITITAQIRQTIAQCTPDAINETTTRFSWKRLGADKSKQTDLELTGKIACASATPTPTATPSATPSPTPTATTPSSDVQTRSATAKPLPTATPTRHIHESQSNVQPRPRQNEARPAPAPARRVQVFAPGSPNRPTAQEAARRNAAARQAQAASRQQQNANAAAAQRNNAAPAAPTHSSSEATPAATQAPAESQDNSQLTDSSYGFNANGRRGGLMSDVEANGAVAVAALLVTAGAGALATFHKGK
jgi:PAT1 multi-domain protein